VYVGAPPWELRRSCSRATCYFRGESLKIIQFAQFGTIAELHLVDIEVPEPGPGQVRVQVRAAGVNALDSKIRSGAVQAVFPTSLPAVPGSEVAGVVNAVGEGVHELSVCDSVFGWSDTGSYTEFALVTATMVAIKPTDLSWGQAVSLPVAVETSQRVLDLLKVKAGETVVLHGAARAVGTLTVQLATARPPHEAHA
jgi:NADPH:quinone reductase-like Zn-dependent oxidoreductase